MSSDVGRWRMLCLAINTGGLLLGPALFLEEDLVVIDVAVLAGDESGKFGVGRQALLEFFQRLDFAPPMLDFPYGFIPQRLKVALVGKLGRQKHGGNDNNGGERAPARNLNEKRDERLPQID